MSITFTLPNIGLYEKMASIASGIGSGAAFGLLFISPASVTDTLDYAALTQPTFPGYGLVQPSGATPIGSNTSTVASCSIAPVTFTCTSLASTPQTIVGAAFALNRPVAGLDLLALGLLPNGPQVVSQPGDSIVVQLTITDQRAAGQP